jgi:hypothetical protein
MQALHGSSVSVFRGGVRLTTQVSRHKTSFSSLNSRLVGNTDISDPVLRNFRIAGYYSLQSSRFLVAIFIFDGEQSQGVRHRLTLVRAEAPRLRGVLTSSLGQ